MLGFNAKVVIEINKTDNIQALPKILKCFSSKNRPYDYQLLVCHQRNFIHKREKLGF